MQLQQM